MTTMVKKIHNKTRKQDLRNDNHYIHIMKYMGSKRELLPDIKKSISKMVPHNSTVLDIFAGTASVGAYLKHDYNIISNDIQNYSKIIANSLIKSSGSQLNQDLHLIIHNIEKAYLKNKDNLIKLLFDTYNKSNIFVDTKKGDWTENKRKEYLDFYNLFPSPNNKFKTKSKELNQLKEKYFDKDKSTYLQTVFLFSETYFSLEQAMDIDSIRFAIDETIQDDTIKNIMLSALMYAYSYCSSGTGHFAMFRDLSDISSIEDTFIYRKKRVWEYFINKFNQIIEYHTFIPEKSYSSYSLDYKDILSNSIMKKVDLIYADPPYSFVHYSRFYHAIESLILYDYDIPKFKGRYRSDRHQSPFCQKTNVENAFDTLFQFAKKNKSCVLLSYSDTGMITLSEIINIITKYEFKYNIVEIQYDHSTLGRKGHKNNSINEYLIEVTF